jgi:hypothetical protein
MRPLRAFSLLLLEGILVGALGVGASTAHAGPAIRGEGEASLGEFKKGGSPQAVRRRALERARLAALESVLAQIDGPVDSGARTAVLRAVDAWTGAYRIISERRDGDAVRVEVEVEVDVSALAKRLTPRPKAEGAPMFRFGRVVQDGGCGNQTARVRDELEAMGSLGASENALAVDFSLRCQDLGPVRHTFVHAVQVQVRAVAAGEVLATADVYGFASGSETASSQGLRRALTDVGAELGHHRQGQITVRVEHPLPAERVRRLERAMRDAALGVGRTEVSGIDPDGAVRLRVFGDVRADALARELEGLSLSGFSLTIVAVEGPDALTVRLD